MKKNYVFSDAGHWGDTQAKAIFTQQSFSKSHKLRRVAYHINSYYTSLQFHGKNQV